MQHNADWQSEGSWMKQTLFRQHLILVACGITTYNKFISCKIECPDNLFFMDELIPLVVHNRLHYPQGL